MIKCSFPRKGLPQQHVDTNIRRNWKNMQICIISAEKLISKDKFNHHLLLPRMYQNAVAGVRCIYRHFSSLKFHFFLFLLKILITRTDTDRNGIRKMFFLELSIFFCEYDSLKVTFSILLLFFAQDYFAVSSDRCVVSVKSIALKVSTYTVLQRRS